MSKLVVGLHGPALSGKDTIADYLLEQKGWGGSFSFARNLKEMCRYIFGLSAEDVYDQEGKRCRFTSPLELTYSRLGGIYSWMCKTHPNSVISGYSRSKVMSFLGTKFNTPRDILQFVGTDVCREFIPTYHVDVVRFQIDRSCAEKAVITDVRFPNEGDFIKKEFGGMVVRLNRPILEESGVNRQHESETSMSRWDGFSDVIDNDEEGLDNLYRKVDRFLERNSL
jgi:hypothetical protein